MRHRRKQPKQQCAHLRAPRGRNGGQRRQRGRNGRAGAARPPNELRIYANLRQGHPMKKVLTLGEILVEIVATEPGDGFLGRSRSLAVPVAPRRSSSTRWRARSALRHHRLRRRRRFRLAQRRTAAADGVDVSAIAVHPEPTGSAFVRYREDGGRDFVFNIRHSACRRDRADRGRRGAPRRARTIFTSWARRCLPGARRSSSPPRTIKGHGGTVSLDPNIRKEMLDQPGCARPRARARHHGPLPAERPGAVPVDRGHRRGGGTEILDPASARWW